MVNTPKYKENASWKSKEREEFGGFDHEFFYHNALFVGYNVTNTLYKTIKAGKGVWSLPPETILQMYFRQRWKMPLHKLIQGCQKNPLVEGLYGSM